MQQELIMSRHLITSDPRSRYCRLIEFLNRRRQYSLHPNTVIAAAESFSHFLELFLQGSVLMLLLPLGQASRYTPLQRLAILIAAAASDDGLVEKVGAALAVKLTFVKELIERILQNLQNINSVEVNF